MIYAAMWWMAYLTVLLSGGDNEEACEVAERALSDFRHRWGHEDDSDEPGLK